MARYDDQRANVFLVLWTLSVAATAVCLLFYLGVRVESIQLGYELGKSQAELSRLREVERVLELELSSSETPERVDLVGRSLFGMQEPGPERVYPAGADPEPGQPRETEPSGTPQARSEHQERP
ncbi:MAG TPA: hypothetical protein VLC09_01060 [Polyangiaceae bacterium]|nr:hypothetical protein [Polyangiaceae bacterium]